MKIPKILSGIYLGADNRRFFFLVAVFSILLNWAGHSFVYENSYKFLYFDMLGTFVAAIVLGSVWGVLVALATAIVLSATTSPHFIYLAVVNMAGALYWGMLSESGNLNILLSKNYRTKSTLKTNFMSSVRFILFAGIGGGLITALFSSVIRNVIFQDISFDQPYSLYFTQLFREVFGVMDVGRTGLFTNYVADTFVEIPDKVLTAFFGIAICLTIFKFNIKTLTNVYHDNIEQKNIAWHKIMIKNFGAAEIFLFAVLGIIYAFSIMDVSVQLFAGVIENISVYSLRDYVFLEMTILPVIIFLIFIIMRFFLQNYDDSALPDTNLTVKDNFYLKNMDSDIKHFLFNVFFISVAVTAVYMYILVKITRVTPVQYYKTLTGDKAMPETLVWLLIMLVIFILIDRKNNSTTETLTLSDELIKQQTAAQISESFDAQRQRLQVLELNWSDNTVEFLKSARHDLINQLEKSKTGLDELLVEVYDNVVKPYSNSILASQKEMRAYVEEITSGKLNEYTVSEIQENISQIIENLKQKTSSYISVNFDKLPKHKKLHCRINKLFFVAFNNILDNSVYALQKRALIPNFKAFLGVKLLLEENYMQVVIYDNAGGLPKDKITRIYKEPVDSSKGERFGEGTMIAKNFVKLLDGHIAVQNIRIYGENGLETAVYLPVYSK